MRVIEKERESELEGAIEGERKMMVMKEIEKREKLWERE